MVLATDWKKGALLLGPDEKRLVFVNNVLVKNMKTVSGFGINLTNVRLDRDRKSFSEIDCGGAEWRLLVDVSKQVAAGRTILMPDGQQFMAMMYKLAQSFRCGARSCGMPQDVADILFDLFQQEHGRHMQPGRISSDALYDCPVVKVRDCLLCVLECSRKFTAKELPTYSTRDVTWSEVHARRFTVSGSLPKDAVSIRKARVQLTYTEK